MRQQNDGAASGWPTAPFRSALGEEKFDRFLRDSLLSPSGGTGLGTVHDALTALVVRFDDNRLRRSKVDNMIAFFHRL